MTPKTPADRVAAAMPGTLSDIAARCGYPITEVMRQIMVLRQSGKRVNAVMGRPVLGGLGITFEPTVYYVDAAA